MVLIYGFITDDQIVISCIHSSRSIPAEACDGRLHRLTASGHFEKHRKSDGLETLVAQISERLHFRIGQNRRTEFHHLAEFWRRLENIALDSPDIAGEGHYGGFPYRIDRWVGHLGEFLFEIIEETLRLLRQDCQRSIVAHCIERLHAVPGHRNEDSGDVLPSVSEDLKFLVIIFHGMLDLPSALDIVENDPAPVEPVGIRMLGGEGGLDGVIVQNLALLGIYHHYLARAKSALAGNLRCRDVENSCL